jgi:lysine 2,3-aminomutase
MTSELRSSAEGGQVARQPYPYPSGRPFFEPDWRRLPGYRDVTLQQWESALWQRRHSIKNLHQLKEVLGGFLSDDLARSIEQDQATLATMPLLVTPQIINCMNERDLWLDPLRYYVLPAARDRHPEWADHPCSDRDSLHETEMWAVEGLIHRYPTKVLAELVTTCPLYCGHCTRMDLVGTDLPQLRKTRFEVRPKERFESMLAYIRSNPGIRDVVLSGGDLANMPISRLESFLGKLLDVPQIKDVRLASKGLVVLPQHFLQDDVLRGLERIAAKARRRRVNLAVHTHVNHANQLTPLVARAVDRLLDMGFRDVRNQGVLMRGVNGTVESLLDLCFTLIDEVRITPYYLYMGDMVPGAEHWRLALYEAHELQDAIMGYLPGFSTPRFSCDVPLVGKRGIFQAREYDRTTGISWWSKQFFTPAEAEDPAALTRSHAYYDPVYTLPPEGREYWRRQLNRC